MNALTLGIVAHVDAGKTSLTERLLYGAGVINEVGRVDDGTTRTDTLALERQRGITIKSAVVSFVVGDTTVNLVDTPGHPDFIAEVERVLAVLDGAVLVVSAVEGVQAQTRVLMRTLRRLGIPTLIFVNKIDRRGAQDIALLTALGEALAIDVAPVGSVTALGTKEAAVWTQRMEDALAEQSRAGRVHPVLFGSALTGVGVDALLTALPALLPAAAGDPDGPASGRVFKVDRTPGGERTAYLRMFSGTVRVRQEVALTPAVDGRRGQKVTGLRVFDRGSTVVTQQLPAGRIGLVTGLSGVRIGDSIGQPRGEVAPGFAAPTLQTVVTAVRDTERGALFAALTQLAEQDPLIDLRRDDVRGQLSVSLYGEVQKEVIQATLATDFGLEVSFSETTTLCIERPLGTGSAVETMGATGNPFLATVGLQVAPGPVGSGVDYRRLGGGGGVVGTMPAAFFTAVEETVRQSLGQGLRGWPVTDVIVTLTHTGYAPRQSHAHATFDKSMSSTGADFRNLTPLVLMSALRRARTVVCEPVHTFTLDVPADTLGAVLSVLARLGAVPLTTSLGGSVYVLEGDVPAARVHELTTLLPALTRGEGALVTRPDRHEPVHGSSPARARTDHNPLHRQEYLLRVQRPRVFLD